MTSAATCIPSLQSNLPFASPLAEIPAYGQARLRRATHPWPAPRLIKSVVDEAGLGKFVYLQGLSGRRYVFSSIRPEQAMLYDHALFAVAPWSGETEGVSIAASFADLGTSDGALYVHLLDDEDGFGDETLNDLCGEI